MEIVLVHPVMQIADPDGFVLAAGSVLMLLVRDVRRRVLVVMERHVRRRRVVLRRQHVVRHYHGRWILQREPLLRPRHRRRPRRLPRNILFRRLRLRLRLRLQRGIGTVGLMHPKSTNEKNQSIDKINKRWPNTSSFSLARSHSLSIFSINGCEWSVEGQIWNKLKTEKRRRNERGWFLERETTNLEFRGEREDEEEERSGRGTEGYKRMKNSYSWVGFVYAALVFPVRSLHWVWCQPLDLITRDLECNTVMLSLLSHSVPPPPFLLSLINSSLFGYLFPLFSISYPTSYHFYPNLYFFKLI